MKTRTLRHGRIKVSIKRIKKYKVKKILLTFIAAFTCCFAYAQKGGVVAAEVDSAATRTIRAYAEKLNALVDKYPTVDSIEQIALTTQYDALTLKCNGEVFGIYAKHIAQGEYYRQVVFGLRNMMGKDVVAAAYKKIKGKDKTESPYALSIKKFIDTPQVVAGGSYLDFDAVTLAGEPFRMSEIVEMKDVLLIISPIDMDETTLALLKLLYQKADYTKMEVVAFSITAGNGEQLRSEVEAGNAAWLNVSDYKGDHSPINIGYELPTLPAFVFIGKGGVVKFISLGASQDVFSAFAQ